MAARFNTLLNEGEHCPVNCWDYSRLLSFVQIGCEVRKYGIRQGLLGVFINSFLAYGSTSTSSGFLYEGLKAGCECLNSFEK